MTHAAWCIPQENNILIVNNELLKKFCFQFADIAYLLITPAFSKWWKFGVLLVHAQVTIIFVVSVCLSVCLFVQSFSQPSDPISIKLGHMLYVWV